MDYWNRSAGGDCRGDHFFGPFRPGQQASALGDFQTVSAERGDLTATVGATGVVHANETALLAWQTTGTVAEVNVQVADQVTAGDVLAALAPTSLSQAIILAQADLVNAQQNLDDLLNSPIQQAQALQSVEKAEQALEDARNPELAQARALEAIATSEKAVEDAERAVRWAKSPASQSLIDEV